MAEEKHTHEHSLPRELYVNYHALRALSMSLKETAVENLSPDLIKTFETMLNNAYPKTDEVRAQRRIVRFLYFANKKTYRIMVRKTRSEATLLWTEPQAIIGALGLQKKLYIRWNNETEKYTVQKHRASAGYTENGDDDDDNDTHPAAKTIKKISKPVPTNQFETLADDDEVSDEEPKKTKPQRDDADSEDIEVADEKPKVDE